MLTRIFTNVNEWLEGWPSAALTLALVAVAVIALYVAMRGSTVGKAFLLAWFIFP